MENCVRGLCGNLGCKAAAGPKLLTQVFLVMGLRGGAQALVVRVGASEAGVTPCGLFYRLRPANDHVFQRLGIDEPENVLLGTLFGRVAHQKCLGEDVDATDGGRRRLQGNSARVGKLIDLCRDAFGVMAELLHGAHLVVEGDRGWWYRYLRNSRLAYPRISSHVSAEQEHGVFLGDTLKTVLTGTSPRTNATWLQFESANWEPWRHPIDSVLHAWHFIEYKLTGQQIGPLGKSDHTDKRPIVVPFDSCTSHR